jgi:hypothetical protein
MRAHACVHVQHTHLHHVHDRARDRVLDARVPVLDDVRCHVVRVDPLVVAPVGERAEQLRTGVASACVRVSEWRDVHA